MIIHKYEKFKLKTDTVSLMVILKFFPNWWIPEIIKKNIQYLILILEAISKKKVTLHSKNILN